MPGTIEARHEERMQTRRSEVDTGFASSHLIDRARAGDGEAWSQIVRELGPRVQGYARGRGVADAEDVMQDVFTAAAYRIVDFDGEWRAFRSWIFSIAYRQIVNRYRSPSRLDTALPEFVIDRRRSGPDEIVVLQETASDAVAALDVLNEVERDVILLRVVAGLDTAEVAKAVGKTPGNVRVIQSRALEKVRAELERRGYDTDGGSP
ncbi:MAG: RNA polymerase sigma factor [Acidimicrobiia bacterium]